MTLSILRVISATLAAGLLAFSALAKDHGPQVLDKPISIPSENVALTQYLVDLFKNANISGGIAIVSDGCQEESPKQFAEFQGSIRKALERLVSMGYQLRWAEADESLVVQNSSSTPSVLNVSVRKFQFSRKEPLTKVSSDLLGSPEVTDQVRRLHLIEYGPEVGFAQVQQPSTPEDVITLENTTVLNALNSIAAHHAVWLYKQSSCGKNQMSLNWPIR